MEHSSRRARGAALVATSGLLLGLAALPGGASAKDSVVKQVAEGRLHAPELVTPSGVTRRLPMLSGGLVTAAAETLHRTDAGRRERPSESVSGNLGVAPGALGCGRRNPDGNVRVNQDCTFRNQAEESIKFNPANPDSLVAGMNDHRIGLNHCGFAFSLDGGKTWGDGIPPLWEHLNDPQSQEPTPDDPNRHTLVGGPGTFHTYDGASDPAVAFDSQGRAFFSCIVFDVAATPASGLFVTQSPAAAGASFFEDVPEFGKSFVVAEDNTPDVVHDKEFIAADTFNSSPNRDNVYVTWTVFRFSPNCGPQPNPTQEERPCASPIFGSMSTDHAVTWSTPEEISGASDTLCAFGNALDPTRNPHACDFDAAPDLTILPSGDVVVVFNNGNTASPDSPNAQQLSVRCHPTGNSPAGTARLNCAAPAKVGDDITVGEPVCLLPTGPSECVPGAFVRTNDFPRVAVDRGNGDLFATWQDYRTAEFDIQLSTSTDGGLTWHEAARPVNPDRGRDHHQAALDVGQDHKVAVSYYRTDRVPNENQPPDPTTGLPHLFVPGEPGVQAESSDYTLAGGRSLQTPFQDRAVSPRFPPPDGNQTGFLGDYSGLTVVRQTAHPIWSDTRNASLPGQGSSHDEDIFTDSIQIPGN